MENPMNTPYGTASEMPGAVPEPCCSAEQQAACCEPAEKAGCCGSLPASSAGCGCQ